MRDAGPAGVWADEDLRRKSGGPACYDAQFETRSDTEGIVIKFTVPVRTRNPLNGSQGRSRGAALGKAARRKKERTTTRLAALAGMSGGAYWFPLTVTLRRVAPRKLDGDGLQAALKSVRDGIADALGVNDGSSAVTWRYEWRKGGVRVYEVEVEIVPNQEQTREVAT